jgi:hypothetical protein
MTFDDEGRLRLTAYAEAIGRFVNPLTSSLEDGRTVSKLSNNVYTYYVFEHPGEVPDPILRVVGGTTGGTWGTNNTIENLRDPFRYRWNFGFPHHIFEEYNLRSFEVLGILHAGLVSDNDEEDVEVRTVQGNVDVTEYFEVTILTITDDGYQREAITITALDTALNNPRFYREWRDLYVDFTVRATRRVRAPSDQNRIWLTHNFEVLGEYHDGEEFEKTSNNVYTFYYMTQDSQQQTPGNQTPGQTGTSPRTSDMIPFSVSLAMITMIIALGGLTLFSFKYIKKRRR